MVLARSVFFLVGGKGKTRDWYFLEGENCGFKKKIKLIGDFYVERTLKVFFFALFEGLVFL